MALHELHRSAEHRQRRGQIMRHGGDQPVAVFSRAPLALGGFFRDSPSGMRTPDELRWPA
jgi:hypothetical protein